MNVLMATRRGHFLLIISKYFNAVQFHTFLINFSKKILTHINSFIKISLLLLSHLIILELARHLNFSLFTFSIQRDAMNGTCPSQFVICVLFNFAIFFCNSKLILHFIERARRTYMFMLKMRANKFCSN